MLVVFFLALCGHAFSEAGLSDQAGGSAAASEVPDAQSELMRLHGEGKLTVRALRAWDALPDRFTRLALSLRGLDVDLLAADLPALQDLVRRARSTEAGALQDHAADLEALVEVMGSYVGSAEPSVADVAEEGRQGPADEAAADDELPPYILPVQAGDAPGPDAGFVLGLLENPEALLDALGGGRPEGDIIALKALLRQAGGPLDEDADQAMNRDLEPYARTTSAKARQAVRRQGEILVQAMLRQQLLLHSAWEFEYAQANMEVAEAVGDDDELALLERIALVQRQEVEQARAELDSLSTLAEAAPPIPSLAELKAEEEELAKALAESVEQEQPAEPTSEIHGGKILIGYLKHDGSHVQEPKYADFDINVLKIPMEELGIVEVNGKSLSYKKINRSVRGRETTVDYTFSWEAPEMIPLYAEELFPGEDGMPRKWFKAEGDGYFNARLIDGGSGSSDGSPVTAVIQHGMGTSESVSNFPEMWSPHPLLSTDPSKKAVQERLNVEISELRQPRYLYVCFSGPAHTWVVYERYLWEPHDFASGAPVLAADPDQIDDEKFDPLAEHQANIASNEKVLERIRREMAAETDPLRHQELRFQALHLEQNIHDSRDIMESIRTGEIVKTRGPWDEHAAVVLARTSQQMADEAARAKELHASYIRAATELEKYDPELAKHFFDVMGENMIADIYRPGGMEHAKAFYEELHSHAMRHARDHQAELEKYQDRAFVHAVRASNNLEYLETLKSGCDKAIFVGSLALGAPGLALGMAYEGATTAVDKGPRAAVKNMAVQGALVLGGMAVIKGGGWAIGKFLNPKVATANPQSFRKVLEANRAAQELEWNRNLVNRLKESAAAVERSKAAGGTGYLGARKSLDEAVKAVDGSFLAKDLMKNEFKSAMAGANSAAGRARLKDVLSYQNTYTARLQRHVHPHVDRKFVADLRRQGYNVEQSWFREFRNASSKGANRDRDLGLLSKYERLVTKNGQPVSMNQFMSDGQKSYNAAYREVTGRSARLADQNITTTMHRESFPTSWLDGRFLQETGKPKDFVAGGRAIYAKVSNALAGPDPYFVNLKKASSSLSKDLGTKVIPALRTPGVGKGLSPAARQAAAERWTGVQKILDDFATDKVDPLTAMKRLREYTGHSSLSDSAAEVRRLLASLGGV
jgi:hypothetical protein